MSNYQKRTKYLHIIFKSSNSIDYIYPYYFKKSKYENHIIEFLIWDPNFKIIYNNLPKRYDKYDKYKVRDISEFFKFSSLFNLNKNFLKHIENYFDNYFFFHFKKLENYMNGFDKIFFDCKSFQNLFFKKSIFKILIENNHTPIYVPHGPHYRTTYDEIGDDNLSVNFFYKLLLSNKKSDPWKKKKIKKQNCIYIGLPSYDKVWLKKINLLKKKHLKKKTIGFIFRPFIKRKSRNQLVNNDYYINSYEENLLMINLSKKLYSKGHDIIFRLHPSSSEKKFLEYYNEDLNNISFNFSKGSIHDFFVEANTIISFHSTSLIYGALYKNRIFLINNDLAKKIYLKWPGLKNIYNSFTRTFENEKQLESILNKRNLRFSKKILEKIW